MYLLCCTQLCSARSQSLLTIQVINFKQKRDFLIVSLPWKLVHCLYKLGQRHRSTSIFVKYSECPFNKKFLKNHNFYSNLQWKRGVGPTFLDGTIFLNSSRVNSSLPFPTFSLNTCSNQAMFSSLRTPLFLQGETRWEVTSLERYLQRVRYHNNKGHELLHRGVVVAVFVNASHQLRHHPSTRPNLRWKLDF